MARAQRGPDNPMYGKTHTQEARTKISESQRGKDHWTYGIGHSEETKHKISKSLTGKTASDETRKKMSRLRAKKNHHNWKGYYEIDGIKYTTAQIAAESIGVRSHTTIYNRVKNPNFPNYKFEPIQ